LIVHNCGTGLGFSVERQLIAKLPEVAEEFHPTDTVIKVKDSKIGWASAFRELISMLYAGHIPKWDLSALRPAGAPLKTFGGRSSGPGPLNDLFNFAVSVFKKAAGRKLTSVECHDLMCKIADVVVVGGVRRCLPGDTIIQVGPNEWKLLKDFQPNDKIYIDGVYQNVKNVFDQGEQKLMKIELEDGKWIESTENHRWLVWNFEKNDYEWVETRNLNENHGFIDPS